MLDDGPIIMTDCAGVAHAAKDVSIPGLDPAVSQFMVSSLITQDGPTAALSHLHPQPTNATETAPSQSQPKTQRGTRGFFKRKEINPTSLQDWKGPLWSN